MVKCYSTGTFLHINTSTKAIFALFFVTAFALDPIVASSVKAAKGGVNAGGSTTTECVHNGNGHTSSGSCGNPSGTTVTTTCTKVHGKFTCTTN